MSLLAKCNIQLDLDMDYKIYSHGSIDFNEVGTLKDKVEHERPWEVFYFYF